MQIINPGAEDYHIHSINFSDGLNTIDEITYFAGKFGLKKIAITDHSQALLDSIGYCRRGERTLINRWKNILNDVEVMFGVEGDLLNEEGDVCSYIQEKDSGLLILSAHPAVYSSPRETITKGYVNAIKKFSDKIGFIGHPCSTYFSDFVNIREVVKAANDYGVALEMNSSNLANNRTHLENLDLLLDMADRVFVNSDAHTLGEMRDSRSCAFDYLRKKGADSRI